MNRRKLFLESISKLGLTANQLNGVISLMESVLSDNNDFDDDDGDEPEEWNYMEWDDADRQAFHKLEQFFVSTNGQPSKIMSLLKEAWDDELDCCGIEIEEEHEYKRSRTDGFPNITVIFSWTEDWDKGTKAKAKVNLRLNWKGKLSFVIFDARGRNVNPYLYKFEGKDISQFEDRYEVSPKYDIAHVKDFIDEVISKVLLYTNLNKDFLYRQ